MPPAVAEFRRGRQSSRGGRVRFTAEARRAALTHLEERVAAGASVKSVARELGLAYETLRRWRESGAAGFRSVALAAQPAATSVATSIVVITAAGHRVEGLGVGDVAELLRALG